MEPSKIEFPEQPVQDTRLTETLQTVAGSYLIHKMTHIFTALLYNITKMHPSHTIYDLYIYIELYDFMNHQYFIC